jgi:hypothetical protein
MVRKRIAAGRREIGPMLEETFGRRVRIGADVTAEILDIGLAGL